MRRLTVRRCSALLLCSGVATAGVLSAAPTCLAQGPSGPAGAARVADARPARPAAEPLQIEQVSPQLQQVLTAWHKQTSQINKLQGEHQRWTYELTFGVEKRAKGNFYYEGPDKGRIDIEAIDPKLDKRPTDKDPSTGQPYTLQADEPQQWVCDGRQVVVINNTMGTYEAFPVPPQQQGANIMDGPLPFLFGMPPEKAKQRYRMELQKEDANMVILQIEPRWREDAANYSKARVMLSKPGYLPVAVELLDPSGNRRTSYRFMNPLVNAGGGVFAIFKGDPFAPSLRGLKQVQTNNPEAVTAAGVPSTIGLNWKHSQEILKARGYEAKIVRGPIATQDKLKFCVMTQSPAPGEPLAAGGTVILTVYDEPATTTN